jgi:hypothetical protein
LRVTMAFLGPLTTLHDLFSGLEAVESLTDAHASQKGDVERAVNPAVKVSAGRRNAALPLKHPEVVRVYA